MSRLAKLRAAEQENLLKMKTFCLDPSLATFKKICESKLRNSDNFNIWKLACLYQYGEDWGLEYDPDDDTKLIQNVQVDFIIREQDISEKAISQPARKRALDAIHIYYALGQLKHIDLFYQCMGHYQLPQSTRLELVNIYRDTKEVFGDEINRLRGLNKDHFANYDMRNIDFTYFDTVKEKALAERERLREQNEMITGINKAVGANKATVGVNTLSQSTNASSQSTNTAQTPPRATTEFPSQIYGISSKK